VWAKLESVLGVRPLFEGAAERRRLGKVVSGGRLAYCAITDKALNLSSFLIVHPGVDDQLRAGFPKDRVCRVTSSIRNAFVVSVR